MLDVVCVNYGTAGLVEELVRRLLAEKAVSRVLLVDNSGDLPGEGVFSLPRVEVIRPGENLGFGRAVNLAFSHSEARYLLVVNPDLRPLEGSVRRLLRTAERTGAVLVGPRFYWDEGRLFRLPPAEGGSLAWDLARRLAARYPLEAEVLSHLFRERFLRFWQARRPFRDVFLSGACLLIRGDFFRQRGYVFDPRYFLYYEDADLCLDVGLRGGLVLCDPGAEMVHFWNQSAEPPGGKARLMGESWREFLRKHYGEECPVRLARSGPGDRAPGPLEDLGQIAAPCFPLLPGAAFVELSPVPFFVPFAQARARGREFRLPAAIWERLAPGPYFVRLVDELGRVLRLFRFERPCPSRRPALG